MTIRILFIQLKIPLCALGVLLALTPAKALELSLNINGKTQNSGLGLALTKRYSLSDSWSVGFGPRLTYVNLHQSNFETAPARLTSGGGGPFVIFKENIPSNIDQFSVAQSSFWLANAYVEFTYEMSPAWSASFNIDVAGLSFGPEIRGDYRVKAGQDASTEGRYSAKPTPYNVLLISDNDIGSLNSEFVLRYLVDPQWSLNAGLSFVFVEYQTTEKLRLENDRFRHKTLSALLGAQYVF